MGGRFGQGNPYRFSLGQTGNPKGRPKGASFSAALSRQALKPFADREEMAKIAKSIGLDPEQAQNIDVVAALFYVALSWGLDSNVWHNVGHPHQIALLAGGRPKLTVGVK